MAFYRGFLVMIALSMGLQLNAQSTVFDTVEKKTIVYLLDSQQTQGKQLILLLKLHGCTFYGEKGATLKEFTDAVASFKPEDTVVPNYKKWKNMRNYVKNCKGKLCNLDAVRKKEGLPCRDGYYKSVMAIFTNASGWVYDSVARRLERTAYIEQFYSKSSRVNPDWASWGVRLRVNNQVLFASYDGIY